MNVGNAVSASPHPKSTDLSIEGLNSGQSGKTAKVLAWLAIIVAVLGSVAFWLLDISATQSLSDKKSQKDLIFQSIQSAEYADVNESITGFVDAYNRLKEVQTDHYAFGKFLPKLYEKIDSDITVENLEISNTGKLSLNGNTVSYRGVADQMVALKSWNVLSNVQLVTVNLNVASNGSIEVPFVISADIDKSVDLSVATPATSPASTVPTSTNSSTSTSSGSEQSTVPSTSNQATE